MGTCMSPRVIAAVATSNTPIEAPIKTPTMIQPMKRGSPAAADGTVEDKQFEVHAPAVTPHPLPLPEDAAGGHAHLDGRRLRGARLGVDLEFFQVGAPHLEVHRLARPRLLDLPGRLLA